ncbi:hypothetical protein HNI00_15325 [Thermoleptolyngbya oregonensis NK1-22]|uniref:Uncharacterized protein n=1 Tax=Thermoleptolyngbya oregonensis NK1-22 TaxID=2547457 RepID=A0AA96Y6E1_9CYAN|nr:hypothetical protein [Thermoleptolyngbya oregonensis]WOB44361.1 hypothetical protein HNI00_15325 [Thermoleptolyngbya oregonensis NK1-22]
MLELIEWDDVGLRAWELAIALNAAWRMPPGECRLENAAIGKALPRKRCGINPALTGVEVARACTMHLHHAF